MTLQAWQNPAGANPDADTFPVRITGTTTWAGQAAYTAVERALGGDGIWIDKPGGRVLGAQNPGIAPTGVTLTPDTSSTGPNPSASAQALARPSQGAGGLVFELTPFGGLPPAYLSGGTLAAMLPLPGGRSAWRYLADIGSSSSRPEIPYGDYLVTATGVVFLLGADPFYNPYVAQLALVMDGVGVPIAKYGAIVTINLYIYPPASGVISDAPFALTAVLRASQLDISPATTVSVALAATLAGAGGNISVTHIGATVSSLTATAVSYQAP